MVFQALEEGVPGRLGLIVIDAEAKNFAMPFLVRSISDHESPGDDPVINTYLEISGIHSQERVIASQRTFTELSDLLIEILADIRDCRFRIGSPTECLHDLADFPWATPFTTISAMLAIRAASLRE